MNKSVVDVIIKTMIAPGYNNYSGLQYTELIKTDFQYLSQMDYVGGYRDGSEDKVMGDGVSTPDGYDVVLWKTPTITMSDWNYLYRTVLKYSRSGKVTIRTKKFAAPDRQSIPDTWVIANAILTLPPQPDTSRSGFGFPQFDLVFTRISVLHEDKMYGEIYVKNGSTEQPNLDTTPVKLTAFAVDGESSGIIPSHSNDSLTPLVDGKYKASFSCGFTCTASTIWIFAFAVNGVIGNFQIPGESNAIPGIVNVALSGILDLQANDVVTVYVKSNDGGGTADITVTNGQLSLISVRA